MEHLLSGTKFQSLFFIVVGLEFLRLLESDLPTTIQQKERFALSGRATKCACSQKNSPPFARRAVFVNVISSELFADFETHLAGCAAEGAEGRFLVAGIHVAHFDLHDIHDLLFGDFTNLGFVGLFRSRS